MGERGPSEISEDISRINLGEDKHPGGRERERDADRAMAMASRS